jgi:hypothetical protein
MSDSLIEFKSGNKWFVDALNKVVSYARGHGVNPAGVPGWSWTVDGWKPPRARAGEETQPKTWAIDVVNAETGSIKIECGTIIKDASDLTGKLDITDEDEVFFPSVGDIARLKLDGPFDDPVATLEVSGDWIDYPAAYDTEGSEDTAEFSAYYYPLWEFVEEKADDTVTIKKDLYARRLVGDYHFLRNAAAYHQDGNKPYAVPFLVPYHRALTP